MLRIICLPLQNIYDVITHQITPPHVHHDVDYQVLGPIAVQGMCMQSPSNSNPAKSRPSGTSVKVVKSFCNLEQTKLSIWLNDEKRFWTTKFCKIWVQTGIRVDFLYCNGLRWLTYITVAITPQANITPVLKNNYLGISGVHIADLQTETKNVKFQCLNRCWYCQYSSICVSRHDIADMWAIFKYFCMGTWVHFAVHMNLYACI